MHDIVFIAEFRFLHPVRPKPELPEAENAEEVALIGEMMRLCLAGKIILKGRVFMDCQPLGLAVRTILQETDNAN